MTFYNRAGDNFTSWVGLELSLTFCNFALRMAENLVDDYVDKLLFLRGAMRGGSQN